MIASVKSHEPLWGASVGVLHACTDFITMGPHGADVGAAVAVDRGVFPERKHVACLPDAEPVNPEVLGLRTAPGVFLGCY